MGEYIASMVGYSHEIGGTSRLDHPYIPARLEGDIIETITTFTTRPNIEDIKREARRRFNGPVDKMAGRKWRGEDLDTLTDEEYSSIVEDIDNL